MYQKTNTKDMQSKNVDIFLGLKLGLGTADFDSWSLATYLNTSI